MKTRLQIKSHSILAEMNVIEIWDGDEFIGQVTGGDDRSVRIFSKYPLEVRVVEDNLSSNPVNILEVRVGT